MEIALIIILIFLILENIALVIIFFSRKVRYKSTIKLNKQIRIEFNSAMINMRRLENFLIETAREDINETN